MKGNRDVQTYFDKVLKEKEILYVELSILCFAIAGSRTNCEESSKVKIHEPMSSGDKRSAKKLEKFLWDM